MPRQKSFKVRIPPQRTSKGDQLHRLGITFLREESVIRLGEPAREHPAPAERIDELDVPTDVLLPEYAIGVGLITRDEYEGVRRDYFTQSQWTLGLIVPLVLLWLALSTRLGGLPFWANLMFFMVIAVAFVGGMDRLHNYHAQLQSLITGKYIAKVMAREAADAAAAGAKPPASGTPAPTLKDLRADVGELKELIERELQRTPVTIVNGAARPGGQATDSADQQSAEGVGPAPASGDRVDEAAARVVDDAIAEYQRRLAELKRQRDTLRQPGRRPDPGTGGSRS